MKDTEYLIINATIYRNEEIQKGLKESGIKVISRESLDNYIAGKNNRERVLILTDDDNNAITQAAYNNNMAIIGFGESYRGAASHVIWEYEDITADLCELVYCRKHGIALTVFKTQRLIVREMQESDLKDLYNIYKDSSITEFVEPLYEYEEELKYTREYIKNMYGLYEYGLWLVYRKADNKLIGRVGIENREVNGKLQPELGYIIGKEFQRQGYAYECCRGVLDYAFNIIKMEAMSLFTKDNNLPSKMLAIKLGFKIQLSNVDKEGLDMYQVTAEEYMNL